MEGGGGLKIIHMHRTREATIGGETLGLVLPSAGPYTPFGAPTTTNTAKAFVHFWVYAISHNGAQKQTNEDRRPTAIAWRRRRRGLLHLHHPLFGSTTPGTPPSSAFPARTYPPSPTTN